MKGAVACLLLAACGGDPLDRLAEGERDRVEAVFGGGRLRLADGTEARLAGVEVPEAGEPGGAEAEQTLSRLIRGRDVALLYGGSRRDGFGRVTAHLRTRSGRRWVQGDLLDAGLARVRTTADDRALAAEMLRREAAARAAGRGSWSDPAWRVALPEEVRPGFVLVEGEIEDASARGRNPRMRFTRPGLELEISSRAAADAAAAGTPVDFLAGQLVRVRGVARTDGDGLVLKVDHPEQIERLQAPSG